MDCKLTKTGTSGQAFGQFEFQVLEPEQPMARQKRTMVGSLMPTLWAKSAMELCITAAGSSST